ncbi:DUF302 domain-containing protein [Hwanghaeella grinnelliae]|uniref:DUF302 domain-containing protein n=1 Tax=Hwanghaeella grinnelliae TaxID=2500179 RepID=A0A437QUI3_9PROT|nr:DUF302 domain-containing protein [Hwanghaeella grinnelliae]RVU38177.1 DUF302 domain-containing protein [Hwanghaeella grinnelliae]
MSETCLKAAGHGSPLLNRYRFPELVSVLCFFVFLALVAFPVAAQDAKYYPYDGAFADAAFEVESAIVDRGLVVDYTSHVGEMLKRTKEDVGGSKTIFENADIFLFCSAVLSREMMEADPANIVHCPYKMMVTESGDGSGKVQVGYPVMPDGPMKKVEALLDEIARSVTGN